jgi:lysozyme
MTSNVTRAAVDLVKHFEGLRLTAYLCPAGVPTIGYGHTVGVRMGQTITVAQADSFLAADLAKAADVVDQLVTTTLTSDQRGALASFVFNLGSENFRTSTLLKKLNARDFEAATGEFGRWIKATVGGKKIALAGLVKRRDAEERLFRGLDWRVATEDGPMPRAVAAPTAMKPLQQSRTINAAKVGGGAATLVATVTQLTPLAQQARDMGEDLRAIIDALPNAGWIVAGVLGVALVYMAWRRIDDYRRQEV